MREIAILGATGSIGTQTLDVVRHHADRFHAAILTARSSSDALFRLAREFKPYAIGLIEKPENIPEDIQKNCVCFFGENASEEALLAVKPDDALAAVVGIAGLNAVMAAAKVCKRILLANKEALVTGGELVNRAVRERDVQLLPVDSEHSAIFQCLQARLCNEPANLILTASGGPFRTWKKEDIEKATVKEALGHPTWRMGKKITVDCATMMNKGLEIIEARYLFSMPENSIEAVIHPESIVHSCVEFKDGAILAQMGIPDMREAIGYAMGYPERLPFGGKRLRLAEIGKLTFEEPDTKRFPCLAIAREALREGGSAPVIMNGANEIAVDAFLKEQISFGRIPEIVIEALNRTPRQNILSVDDVWEADRAAREIAKSVLGHF